MKRTLTFKGTFLALGLMFTTGAFAQTSVYDIIQGSPAHSSLEALIDAAGLAATLDDQANTFTVFAPDNDAIDDLAAELGLTIAQVLALPQADLSDIVLYHALNTEVGSGDITNGDIVTPLNADNTLKLTVDGMDVFVNQAQVNAPNLGADNGVVHSIDAVLVTDETVADIVIGSADHTTLLAAVVAARLLPDLTNPYAELTVFGPTDDAFTAALTSMGITATDLLASPDLTDILLYHVLGAEVEAGDLSNGDIAQPLNAANTLKVTIDGTDVFINQAQVLAPDLFANNGVVHSVGGVLLEDQTVADIVIGSAVHTTLLAAVVEARLLPALTNPFAELTVFAPTDAAFTIFLTGAGITATDLLADANLANILLYHVLGSEEEASDLVNGTVTTLSGGSVTVDLTMGVMINDATVTGPDNFADNGVVHVIDAVLIDPTASLEDIENLTISMYPNPATDFITIDSNDNGTFTIVDVMGAVVAEGVVDNNKVNVSALNIGTYFVNFTTANGVYQGRFVKN